MESVTGRGAARCVAVFHLVGSCFLFLLLVTLHIWSDFNTSGRMNQNGSIWYILIASSIYTLLGASFSLILVKATSPTFEPKKGLRWTKSWLIFNLIFFALGVMSLIFIVFEMKVFTVIGLVVQLVFIKIVLDYKRHLQIKVDESEPEVRYDRQVEDTV